MGIQAWFMFFGVVAMTLIVWDGARRKMRSRTALPMAGGAGSEVRAVRPRPLPVVSMSDAAAGTESVEANPVVCSQSGIEGSRIGVATRVSGKLIANEPVMIKGSIEGAVIARDHHVMVTMSGKVSSYLEGREISVDGQVVGTLKAGQKITLRSRARIRGVLEAGRLECLAGARVQGEVARMAEG